MNQQQRAVVQQALEALENTSPLGFNMEADKKFFKAITALRQLLEQPAPAQEPVAVVTATNHLDGRVKWLKPFSQGLPLGTEFYTTPPAQPEPPEQELVGYFRLDRSRRWYECSPTAPGATPLYAATPTQGETK